MTSPWISAFCFLPLVPRTSRVASRLTTAVAILTAPTTATLRATNPSVMNGALVSPSVALTKLRSVARSRRMYGRVAFSFLTAAWYCTPIASTLSMSAISPFNAVSRDLWRGEDLPGDDDLGGGQDGGQLVGQQLVDLNEAGHRGVGTGVRGHEHSFGCDVVDKQLEDHHRRSRICGRFEAL